MDDLAGILIAGALIAALIAGAIWLAIQLLLLLLSAVWWGVASLSTLVFSMGDTLFFADVVTGSPWLLWAIWGVVMGGCIGFWTIAPAYGLRHVRSLFVISPIALLFLSTLIAHGL